MATLVRLSEQQIEQLLDQADQMEDALKQMHEELASLDIPKDTMTRYTRMHDRFTGIVTFLRRQRELRDSSG